VKTGFRGKKESLVKERKRGELEPHWESRGDSAPPPVGKQRVGKGNMGDSARIERGHNPIPLYKNLGRNSHESAMKS